MEETLKSLILCIENIQFNVIKKNSSLLTFLLDNGIDVNDQDNDGNTLLHIACENGLLTEIDIINTYTPNLNIQNNDGNTALHIATLNNDLTCVTKMVTIGADKEILNNRNKTSYTIAIENNNTSIISYLESNGSLVPSDDIWGSSILHYAAKNGNTPLLISYLNDNLENKYTLMNKKDKHGNTPLHVAVYNNQLTFVQELITQGANVNIFNDIIKYPLHLAVLKGNLTMVQELCENGNAILDLKDKNNETPLKFAVFKNEENIADYLISKGADINIVDTEGRSVLHDAYNRGNYSLVDKIKNNVKFTLLTHKDIRGRTADYYNK